MKNLKTFICDPDTCTFGKVLAGNNILDTVKLMQGLLEDTNAHLELDTRGIWFVRYFENGHVVYKKCINEALYMPHGSVINIVKHHLYESQYEFETRYRKKEDEDE